MVAAMRVGKERFRTVRHPFHRPADLTRRPETDDFLRIDENLRAEAAADVGRDHPQLVLGRDPDEGGNNQPRDVRILRRIPERETVGAGIVFTDRRARLDRVGRQPIVNEVEAW